jgi:pimeloyl-ACP methyl ester carboxylesterase
MSHYVLVHGAWEGGWSWENVIPFLESSGHKVTIVQLPGSSGNTKLIDEVTLDSYISEISEVIESSKEQVVLVGHSLGGVSISQVAEKMPDRIDRLVYVAAFLLQDGATALEAMQSDAGGEMLPQLLFSDDQSYAEAPESAWRNIAFNDASIDAVNSALPRLAQKQATEPFVAKLELSTERFGSVPKYVVRTSLDKVFSTGFQDRMIENWPVVEVVTLESGHFPALSMPRKLASTLLSMAPVQKTVHSVGDLG